jgi:hypothetical protein
MTPMYRAKVLVLSEHTSHFCGRLACKEKATFFISEVGSDGKDGPTLAYCDIHYSDYANNGMLEIISVDDPHNRLQG